MDKDYLPKNKLNMLQSSFKTMNLMNNKKINYFEFIPKEKVLAALIKMELKKVDLLFNIMVNFINLGNGMKDKILLKKP